MYGIRNINSIITMTTLTKGWPSSIILLKGGTVLTHSPTDDKVIPLHDTDVLVLDNIIAQVGKDISPPVNDATTDAQVEIIDCKGKIVSPGFIDTHHHLWQTQLKGRHAEEGLVAYMVSGVSSQSNPSPLLCRSTCVWMTRKYDVLCVLRTVLTTYTGAN